MDETPFELQEQYHREGTISGQLQDLIGRCMSLEADLLKEGLVAEEKQVERFRQSLVEVAIRLEIPLEVKE